MSRKVNLKTVKIGDPVRVGRESGDYGPLHGIKFGAVCRVTDIDRAEDGAGWFVPQLKVDGPLQGDEFQGEQWVDVTSCKVAK